MKKNVLIVAVGASIFALTFLSGICSSQAQEPYVIGYITDSTGVFKANLHPESEGFRLFVDDLNARGGVNGHPVKLIIEDGKSEPAQSTAVARKLIEKDNVLALVGLGVSDSQPPVIELAKKAKLAVLTGYICISKAWDSPPGEVVFATGHSMHAEYHTGGYTVARGIQATYPKGTKMGILGMTLSGSRIWNDWVVEWLKKYGYDVVYRDEIAPGTVDVSSWVMKTVKANPDAVYSGASNVQMPLALALEKMAYTKDFMITDFTPEADVAKIASRLESKGENLLWVSRYASPNENIPEIDKIRAAITKHGANFPISTRHIQGWVMGIVMEAALKRTAFPASREAFVTALEKTNVDTRGLTGGPVTFTAKDHHGPSWWKVYRWNAGKQASMPAKDWFRVEVEGIAKK